MRSRVLVNALAAVILPLSLAGPAFGDTLAVDDPAGDGLKGKRLDITSLKLGNRDRAIVVRVSLVRAAAGDLGIWLQARGTKRNEVALIGSYHRPQRVDRNFVRTADGVQDCKGLRVTWDHDADRVWVRVPSKCFRTGDYGAVRTRIITEIGSDADLAPEAPGSSKDELRWSWSDWVDRG